MSRPAVSVATQPWYLLVVALPKSSESPLRWQSRGGKDRVVVSTTTGFARMILPHFAIGRTLQQDRRHLGTFRPPFPRRPRVAGAWQRRLVGRSEGAARASRTRSLLASVLSAKTSSVLMVHCHEQMTRGGKSRGQNLRDAMLSCNHHTNQSAHLGLDATSL